MATGSKTCTSRSSCARCSFEKREKERTGGGKELCTDDAAGEGELDGCVFEFHVDSVLLPSALLPWMYYHFALEHEREESSTGFDLDVPLRF